MISRALYVTFTHSTIINTFAWLLDHSGNPFTKLSKWTNIEVSQPAWSNPFLNKSFIQSLFCTKLVTLILILSLKIFCLSNKIHLCLKAGLNKLNKFICPKPTKSEWSILEVLPNLTNFTAQSSALGNTAHLKSFLDAANGTNSPMSGRLAA